MDSVTFIDGRIHMAAEEDPPIHDTGRSERYQIENGNFFRMATLILEDLMSYKFTLRQRLMVDVVVRMTYGYSRKEAVIKPGLFSKLTGLARQHCHSALKELVEAKVLKRDGNAWQYNKYSDQWGIEKRQNVTDSVTKLPNKDVTESVTSNDNDVTKTVTNHPQKCHRIGSTTKDSSIKTKEDIKETPLTPKGESSDFQSEFEEAFNALPKRAGPNNKKKAFNAFKARRRVGVPAEKLIAGAKRYATHERSIGNEGTRYVMMAATFFGPDDHWNEPWTVESKTKPKPNGDDRPRCDRDDFFSGGI